MDKTAPNETSDFKPGKCQERLETFLSDCEKQIREEPLKAVLVGVGGGFVLSRLPLIGLLTLVIRLALWAVKPALVALGAMWVVDYVRKNNG